MTEDDTAGTSTSRRWLALTTRDLPGLMPASGHQHAYPRNLLLGSLDHPRVAGKRPDTICPATRPATRPQSCSLVPSFSSRIITTRASSPSGPDTEWNGCVSLSITTTSPGAH